MTHTFTSTLNESEMY